MRRCVRASRTPNPSSKFSQSQINPPLPRLKFCFTTKHFNSSLGLRVLLQHSVVPRPVGIRQSQLFDMKQNLHNRKLCRELVFSNPHAYKYSHSSVIGNIKRNIYTHNNMGYWKKSTLWITHVLITIFVMEFCREVQVRVDKLCDQSIIHPCLMSRANLSTNKVKRQDKYLRKRSIKIHS